MPDHDALTSNRYRQQPCMVYVDNPIRANVFVSDLSTPTHTNRLHFGLIHHVFSLFSTDFSAAVAIGLSHQRALSV